MARVGYKRTGGRAILLMINVSFTISFVSFHISFRTTSHSILSFRSSIVRTYNLHSLRLHPKMYFFAEKGLFSSLLRSVPEKILLKKIFSTAAPTTSCAPRSCNILSIENNLCCNSRRTANQTRRGEGKYGKSLAAPRLGTLQ